MAIVAALAVILLAVAIAPAAIAAWRAGATGPATAMGAIGALVATAIVSGAAHAPSSKDAAAREAAPDRPLRELDAGYVGSEACRACHPSEYGSWHASYHRTMTQAATPATVRGPLDALPAEARGALELRGDEYVAVIPNPAADGTAEHPDHLERPISLVTGSHHMQTYWVSNGEGRSLSLFPWAWLSDDQRWIPRTALFLQPPGLEAIGAMGEPGGWNRGCVKCHTTAPRGRAAEGQVIDTRVGELGIACEACHGPGGEHARANSDPLRRFRLHLAPAPDPTITLPTRLPHGRDSEVCGQCHSIWVYADDQEAARYHESGSSFRPGQELGRSKIVLRRAELDRLPAIAATLAEEPDYADRYWWRDGMVRVTGREYNGLIESPCYRSGQLSCSSCHTLHPRADDPRSLAAWADDQLRPESGDALCLKCHPALSSRVAAHSHHAESSTGSRCMSCHMPNTTWGLLGATRSHTISSPSVKESLETGRPNACNQCHLDRTLAWTAERLAAWYGQAQPELDEDQRTVAASVLWTLAGDAGQRALMAWSFGWADARKASGEAWMAPFVAVLLDDDYVAVRLAAGRALGKLDAGRGVPYDFAASAAARQEAQRAYYHSVPSVKPEAARPELLQLPTGEFDVGRMNRIAEGRDRRPVALWE